ncbi:hypothetical protein AtEden1_Chr3g0216221 [Arabidopsis thaliana]
MSCESPKITDNIRTTGDVEQSGHFLGKLSCLELLEVKIWGTRDRDGLQTTKELLMLPKVQVQDHGQLNHALHEEQTLILLLVA